ncbi:hypothetical protein ACOME3_006396 [Neoechinorhynchus agilis]
MDLEFKQPQRLRRVKSADFPESPYKEPMRSISIERDVPLDIKSHECQYSSDVSKHQNRKHKERPMNVINIRSDPQKSPIPKPDPRSKRRTLRSPKAGRLVCDVCDKFGTYSADKFYIHMAAHRNLKPFKCSYCGQRANYKSDVQKHIRNRKSMKHMTALFRFCPKLKHEQQSMIIYWKDIVSQLRGDEHKCKFNQLHQHHWPYYRKQHRDPDVHRVFSDELGLNHKCTRCFYRCNTKIDFHNHFEEHHNNFGCVLEVPQSQSLDYLILPRLIARKTFFMYEDTFGNLLDKPFLAGFIEYNEESFERVLSKVAVNVLNAVNIAKSSPESSNDHMVHANRCLFDFLEVYTANDPVRSDKIKEVSQALQEKTIKIESCDTEKKVAYSCSSCVRFSTFNEAEAATHLFLHLQNGGIHCSKCNYSCKFYNLAIVHNIKMHGNKAIMRLVSPDKNSRIIKRRQKM